MVFIHAIAAAASVVKVRCTHCGATQARKRSKSGRYVCSQCRRSFSAPTATSAKRER